MNKEKEMQIIKKVLAGDKEAFEELVISNQKSIYNLALRMTKNYDNALELTQEAFLRAYAKLASFNGNSGFSVWLYRIASNLCIDFLRKSKRGQSVSFTVADNEDMREREICDDKVGPEQAMLLGEIQTEIKVAVDGLSTEHRQVIVLRDINGLSYLEIARVLSITEGTVKSRLFRAREQLRKVLQRNGNIEMAKTSKEIEGGERRG